MPNNPLGYWRTGGVEPPTLPRGRHHLTREEVAASQKGRVMRAALHELGSKGANPMTVGAIVERAHVSKKVFYDHFEGLAECVNESLMTLNIVAGSEMAKAADAADSSEPFGKVRAVLGELIESARDEPILTTALLFPGFGLDEPGAKAWLFYEEVRSKMLMAWYDDERERAPDLPETTLDRSRAAFAAFEFAILTALASDTADDLVTRADEVVGLVVAILSNGGAQYPAAV
ncbi:MAG: helix-turn-helix domain-containing protein [Actinomycetes bacterium]